MAGRRRKVDEAVENTVAEVKKESKKIEIPRREVIKRVSKTTEVMVLNNTVGRVFFNCKNGEELDIKYGGDTTVLSVEALMEIKNKAKSLLSKFYIVPVEIVSDDEATLEDVVVYLGLNDIYDKDNLKMEEYINTVINSKPDEFERLLEVLNESIIKRLAEKAIDLYADGEFDSTRKQQALCRRLKNENLFEDIV